MLDDSKGGFEMDTQFVWQEDFNIGVDVIDKEHQKLFKIINKLFSFREKKTTSQWACQEGCSAERSCCPCRCWSGPA